MFCSTLLRKANRPVARSRGKTHCAIEKLPQGAQHTYSTHIQTKWGRHFKNMADTLLWLLSFILSSDDLAFSDGLFVARHSAVSEFVDTIQKAVINASCNSNFSNMCYKNNCHNMPNHDYLPTKSCLFALQKPN